MIKDRLKELRAESGMSQKELALALRLSPSTIAMYETGHRVPDAETLKKIADYFQITVDYLLGRTNARKSETIAAAHAARGYENLPPDIYQKIKEIAEYFIREDERREEEEREKED